MDYDVVIAGAGPAGLSLAAALAQAPVRVLLVEQAPLSALQEPAFDGREIALTQASMRRLEELGAWARIAPNQISPLHHARVLNGQSPFALDFKSRRAGEHLGALVANCTIRKALFETVAGQANCTLATDRGVASLRADGAGVEAILSDGTRVRAKLAAAADTRFSKLRQAQGISARMVDFGRTMLAARMAHEKPHDGVAVEWFGHGHTLAMLPLRPGVSSYVLTLPSCEIEALMAMSAEEFAADALARTQGRWGKLTAASTRHAYPLAAVYADRFVGARFALAGDAAVGMHPVTAHGYNFGLSGAWRLAEAIGQAARAGGDIGGDLALARYERGHRAETLPLFLATNAIAKLYTDERPLMRLARASGLRLMQSVSPAKRLIEARLSA